MRSEWEGEQSAWMRYPTPSNSGWYPVLELVQQDLNPAFQASGGRTYWSLVSQLAMRPRLEVAFRGKVLVRQWQAIVTDDVSPYVLYYTGSHPPQQSWGAPASLGADGGLLDGLLDGPSG